MAVNSLTLYGIGSCDRCRGAKKWLTDQSHDYDFHDLRDDGLDIQMLERWTKRITWQKLLNTRSLTWRASPAISLLRTDRIRSIAP